MPREPPEWGQTLADALATLALSNNLTGRWLRLTVKFKVADGVVIAQPMVQSVDDPKEIADSEREWKRSKS